MNNNLENNRPDGKLIESTGPWSFVTRRVFSRKEGQYTIWRSRCHRKALVFSWMGQQRVAGEWWHCLWMPRQLNWWIGSIFALGSLLFAIGSILCLPPEKVVKMLLS